MTKAEFNALYNLFEAVATAIDKCHLRKLPACANKLNRKSRISCSVP